MARWGQLGRAVPPLILYRTYALNLMSKVLKPQSATYLSLGGRTGVVRAQRGSRTIWAGCLAGCGREMCMLVRSLS